MKQSILIKNGRILDPASGMDEIGDLFLAGGLIAECGGTIDRPADLCVDAAGCYVMPGLIDLHVHFRDPGLTWKEDIESGSKAAAHGGFTTVVCMPNTKPVIDCAEQVDYVAGKAGECAPIHVLQAGAVTKGQKGEVLADIDDMAAHGIPAISEDGKSVMDAALYVEGMKLAAKNCIPVLAHCEDKNLVRGGCVNADEISQKEKLPGITNAVEDVIVARDILLAKEAGVHLHLCHCSTKGSYEMLKFAKENGYDVSGEVCPHHFALTSSDRIPGDTNYKMNPPLRTAEDVKALKKGLADGTFEAISTDHAPHSAEEKNATMEKAPFGIVGLETAAALTFTELVKTGILTPLQMAEKMSTNPARILHLQDRGSLAPGMEADVCIFDPEKIYQVDKETFLSKGKNTPFHGKTVAGEVRMTICAGKIIYKKG